MLIITITIVGLPVAEAKPKAINAADLSSIAVKNSISDLFANAATDKASGEERLPGQRTICSKPSALKPSKSLRQIK